MIRSGRCRAGRPLACALRWALLLGVALPANAIAESPQIDARFRLQWPSESAKPHWVRVELTDPHQSDRPANIDQLQNHSQSPLATGAFEVTDDSRTLLFRPRGPIADGAVEFRVRASRDATLGIQVIDRSTARDADRCFESETGDDPTIIALKSVLSGETYTPSSDTTSSYDGPDWSLSRTDQDGLRINLDNHDLLYENAPGSELAVHFSGHSLTHLASQAGQLRATITRIDDDAVVASHRLDTEIDADGNFDNLLWQTNLPSTAGVYEIRCELKQPESRIWSKLRRQHEVSAIATQPLVVLPEVPASGGSDAREWREIALIRPSETNRQGLGQWLPSNTARLNPLAIPSPIETLGRGEHAGQGTSILVFGRPYETTLPTLVPGLPQQVTVRFPAGRSTRLRVEVIHPSGNLSPDFILTQEAAAIANQDWIEHTFVYYPSDGGTRIRLTNLASQADGMIESISVKAGPGRLADLDSQGSRPIEDRQRLAVYSLSDFDWDRKFAHDINTTALATRFDARTISLHQQMVAATRLADYLRSSGMNAVVIPAIAGSRAAYPTGMFHPSYATDRIDRVRLKLLMRLLERSSLRVFAGVETSTTLTDVETDVLTHPGLASGVSRKTSVGQSYNPFIQSVQSSLATLASELDEQLRPHDHYAGIAFLAVSNSHVAPPPTESVIDPVTLSRFARSSFAPGEIAKMTQATARAWVLADGRQPFEQWMSEELSACYERITEGVSGKTILCVTKADASADCLVPNDRLVVVRDLQRVPAGALPIQLRLDPPKRSGSKSSASKSASSSKQTASAEPSDRSDRSRGNSHVGFCISDAKVDTPASSAADDPYGATSQPTLRIRTCGDVTRILERSDPHCLMFDGSNGSTSINHELANLLRDWAELPIDGIADVHPPDPKAATAKLRFGRSGQYYYLAVMNLAPWQSDVTVQTSTALNWQRAGKKLFSTVHPDRSKPDSESDFQNEGLRTNIRLQPRGMIVLRSDATVSNVSVLDWFARVHGGKEPLDEIARQVTAIVDRLGGLADPPTYESLSNGGFESESSVGLAGWLHAQHPPGAVRIDDTESIEGEHSVRLTTDQSVGDRTWLVSEMIQPPRSGRLGVSLACRGELIEGGSTHRLRVSIEGTRAGEPIRKSIEIKVPHNGQWRPRQLVLEVEGVDPSSVDMLRLTIDSLSRGRVWVDDVRLHDWFPLSKERAELQGEAYVAVQGLQRGNLTPAARLIQNEWAQHLLANDEPAPAAVITTVKPEESSAGVAERIRNWLPTPLRF
tara:strand:- start:526128 stop:529946 length:3819 start_codon:yes stop_codon:yes gene_type:complete